MDFGFSSFIMFSLYLIFNFFNILSVTTQTHFNWWNLREHLQTSPFITFLQPSARPLLSYIPSPYNSNTINSYILQPFLISLLIHRTNQQEHPQAHSLPSWLFSSDLTSSPATKLQTTKHSPLFFLFSLLA